MRLEDTENKSGVKLKAKACRLKIDCYLVVLSS